MVTDTAGVAAFTTALPLASLIVACAMVVVKSWAGRYVLSAEQPSVAAGPKTLTLACTLAPADVAVTEQGCVGEFVAVAAKRPFVVIAPQPPFTVHSAGIDEVNWSDCPTPSAALAGVIDSG